MIIQPKTHRGNWVGKEPEHLEMLGITIGKMDEGEEETISLGLGSEGLWLECIVTHPPSAKGKGVHLWVPPQQVVPLMKALRDVARELRSIPLGGA